MAGVEERTSGAAFMLNELELLRDEREIDDSLYLNLRSRYLPLLGREAAEPSASRPAPEPSPAPATPQRVAVQPIPRRVRQPAAKPEREGPGWLAEQQANLLLYLGAFLIVIAALVYVGYSGQASQALNGSVKMALLSAYTLFFFAAGLLCLRAPRVRQAGVVFVALGALMVPINFAGAYGFFFADNSIDPTGLWLAGSICSALFYAAISYAGLGKWYSVPMTIAAFSALVAGLVLSNAPAEAYPGNFIALSLLLALPQMLPLGKVSDTFGPAGAFVAHLVVPAALLVALGMTPATAHGGEEIFALTTRWYFPPTVAIGALFYWAQAIAARRTLQQFERWLCVIALAASGAAALALVYALDVGNQWYGPAVAIVAFLYGLGAVATTGSRWAGQRSLSWMGLAAITIAWLCFEATYASFPRLGASVHLAAAVFYLAAARLSDLRLPLFLTAAEDGETRRSDVPAAIPFVWAAALTFGIGVFEIVSAVHHVGTTQPHDVMWTFFSISLVIALVAATTRWWWPQMKLHMYAISFAMSMFVLIAAADAEGDVTLFLGVYSGAMLAFAIWERQPLGLALPAAFGFAALLAGWRFYDPNDAALPLVLSAAAAALFATSALLPIAARRRGRSVDPMWAPVLQAIAFTYAIIAPIAGGARLAMLASDSGLTDSEQIAAMHLFQTTAIAVALVAVAGATTRWWWQGLRPYVYATALSMAVAISATSAPAEGQVIILLAAYGALALALTIWERQPFALVLPASFGFAALLAGWRFFEPNDAALPLVLSAAAGALFVTSALLPTAAQRLRKAAIDARWASLLQAIAFAYAVAAPIVGGVRLAMLSDESGMIGSDRFDSTLLFQMIAVSVGLVAVAGATTRWWLKDLALHVYGIALIMSIGIALASAGAEGQVIVVLAGYGALALALIIWERQPFGLAIPAGFTYFALVAAWRYYEPNDVWLPLSLSALAAGLFALAQLFDPVARRAGVSNTNRAWPAAVEATAFAFAVVAPITGWLRLAILADDSGFIGSNHFEATALYQTAAASVALLAALVLARSVLSRRLDFAIGASALVMVAVLLEIGHLRPENAQAYTAPLGAYMLVAAMLSLRVRGLPEDVQVFVPLVEVLGAALIMGPSFVQSLDADAWRYGLILLVEGIGFVTLALIQRRIWLIGVSTTLVVMDGAHYLLFAGGPAIPNWAILALAGTGVMAAGTAILLGRERWTAWQHTAQSWWYRHEMGSTTT